MLTKNQLKQLRSEITLNSLYLRDYSNSLYIKEKTACSFFDSFIEYIYDRYDLSGLDLYDALDKYDNIDELYDYYLSFEYDPLPQDDYIAYSNDTIFSGVVVYDIQYGYEDYILCASCHNNSYGVMEYDRITKNKIYYDKNSNGYIIKNKKKYYIDNFIRAENKR